MARPQTMASLEAKEELTLKQIQELEEKLRAKKAQLKKVQTQTLTASNKKFKEYGLDLKNAALAVGIAEMIAKFGTQTGLIISTGGGCVTVPKNFAHLRQNGRIYQLTQPVENLSTSGRVLSSGGIERLRELEATRTPMYESFAQCIVKHNRNAPETVATILEDFEANLL